MKVIEQHACFGGWQYVYEHEAKTVACTMRLGVYVPPHEKDEKLPVLYWLSGLTCNEQNFITKANAQAYASQHKIILVAPDTSPRGEQVADAPEYDLGQGAGFYINATQAPWNTHYQMYDYVVSELPQLIDQNFPTSGKKSIFGHSMGGHGALTIGLREQAQYQSISAFAPIVAPSYVAWGQKAFTAYFGDDQTVWSDYDAVELIKVKALTIPILIDQGTEDPFLKEQLKPELLAEVCKDQAALISLNMRDGYDHSYYFIMSFMQQHIAFHAQYLK